MTNATPQFICKWLCVGPEQTLKWPLKRLRLTDEFMVAYGGEEGIDSKIMFVFPHQPFYYTAEMMLPFDLSTRYVPFNIHRTTTGQSKTREPLLFGSFDVQSFVQSLPAYTPTVRQVDLSALDSEEVFLLDSFMPKLFTKEVRVTPDLMSSLTFTTGQQLARIDFRVALATGGATSNLILNTPGNAYSISLPNLERCENTLEKSMSYTIVPNAEDIVRSDLKLLKLQL